MNVRRALAAAATGLVLSATAVLAGGPAAATEVAAWRPSALSGRPAHVRGPGPDVAVNRRAESPAELRALRRSLGLPVSTAAGLAEWAPATATAIDGRGGCSALAARLTLEYSGAVPGHEVAKVVHRVAHELHRDHVPASRLLDVVEATCRRELTDQLARGTSAHPRS